MRQLCKIYSRNLESHSLGIWMKREAQQILICQKQSTLGGRFCHRFSLQSLHPSLPPSSAPSVSGVLLCPAQSTNETCVTWQAAYLHYTWAASLEDNAVRDHFNCGGQKGKCELIDSAGKEKDTLLLGQAESLPNCCSLSLKYLRMYLQIHLTSKYSPGDVFAHFQGP